MTDRTSIDGSVNVTLADDSAAGVAFQLAKHIAAYEGSGGLEQKREYWLDLYARCWKATHGRNHGA
jgi:hypothetical protein